MTTKRPRAIREGVLALATVLLLVGLGQGSASAKATLRWKFKEGEVLHYSMDQNTVQTDQDQEGRDVKQTFGLILDMTWTIKAVDPSGVATITQTIDRVRTTAAAPFGKFSFDSKDLGNTADPKAIASAAGAAGLMIKVLVGAEFTSKMNPQGEVTEVKLADKLLANLRGDNDPAVAQGPFSEAGLKNIIMQMVTPVAAGSVELGETWKRSMAIPAGPDGQTRQVEQTFTYKGPDPTSASLEKLEFTTRYDPPKADPNVAVTVKKETQIGRIEFDNAAGRVAKSTVTEEVELSISIQGKEVHQKAETSRVLTLSKDKAP
jgi:predicted secreted protein